MDSHAASRSWAAPAQVLVLPDLPHRRLGLCFARERSLRSAPTWRANSSGSSATVRNSAAEPEAVGHDARGHDGRARGHGFEHLDLLPRSSTERGNGDRRLTQNGPHVEHGAAENDTGNGGGDPPHGSMGTGADELEARAGHLDRTWGHTFRANQEMASTLAK